MKRKLIFSFVCIALLLAVVIVRTSEEKGSLFTEVRKSTMGLRGGRKNVVSGQKSEREKTLIVNSHKKVRSELSYKEKYRAVDQLLLSYPKSKEELIKVITKEDYYKSRSIAVEPHTIDDVVQNQEGALKIYALRKLMDLERDIEKQEVVLNSVIQIAKDPTVMLIAKAALQSLQKKRSFFTDFTDGIESMPL